MKKSLTTLLLAMLPALVVASGDHAAGHDKGDSSTMSHDMGGMEGMSHGESAGVAGRPGDAAKVDRTIDVSMDDSMRFNPNSIRVKAGETVRFFIRNTGSLDHEMVIGTLAELKEHSAMMKKMPTMQHAEPNMIRLGPGQRGGIVWQFDKPGIVDFACLVPGHMEAGMVGKVTVN